MRRISLRSKPGMQHLKFVKYRKQAVKKLRTLIAMVKTTQKKLQSKAEEASLYLSKLDGVSADRVSYSIVVDMSTLIDRLTIQLDDLKYLKERS